MAGELFPLREREDDIVLPQTLPYFLAERIQRGIITGKYKPGASLREQELGSEFGSSRGPIRECLRLLELRGLVEHSPRRGFRVRDYTEADIESLYRLRGLLEPAVIDALSGKDLGPLIVQLNEINNHMRKASRERDLSGYFDFNIQFHFVMATYADDRPLARVLAMVNDMSLPLRYMLHIDRFPGSNDTEYHSDIVALLGRGKFAQAKIKTVAHIQNNLPLIKKAYRRLLASE